MRQVAGLISTYSSDEFGICSALYELGGMVVMHDASGCNSTYTTHDEPRWYDMDSMIFISAISEAEAIMGDDDKFINDLIDTAKELHPGFIAVVGAPIPYMIGTDLDAIANIVSQATGIPCFGFAANGMHHYTKGISMALEKIVEEFAKELPSRMERHNQITIGQKEADPFSGKNSREQRVTVNILGATPLDFSLNGSVEAMQQWISDHGMENGVCLSMGCTLADVARLGEADVNLVVSYGGLAAAKVLEHRFHIPYVVGVPFGEKFSAHLLKKINQAVKTGKSMIGYGENSEGICSDAYESGHRTEAGTVRQLVIIGESVLSCSLAEAICMEHALQVKVLCPLDTNMELLRQGDCLTPEEDDLILEMKKADGVIADPLYQSLIDEQKFFPLPHEAFSGRIHAKMSKEIFPGLIGQPL